MSQKLLTRIEDELKKCLNHESNELQEAINELTSAFESYIAKSADLSTLNEELQENSINLTKANVDLINTIKSIQLVLGSHREKFKKLKSMPELMKTLDNFVLSSSAVQAGAVENANS